MKLTRMAFLMFSLCLMLIGHSSVHAHSVLLASTPGSEQPVAAPERLALQFNEGVRMLRLSVTDANNEEVTVGFSPNATAQSEFEWELPTLEPGDYAVEWTIIGSDGHTLTAGLTFTVDPAGEAQDGLVPHENGHGGHSH